RLPALLPPVDAPDPVDEPLQPSERPLQEVVLALENLVHEHAQGDGHEQDAPEKEQDLDPAAGSHVRLSFTTTLSAAARRRDRPAAAPRAAGRRRIRGSLSCSDSDTLAGP